MHKGQARKRRRSLEAQKSLARGPAPTKKRLVGPKPRIRGEKDRKASEEACNPEEAQKPRKNTEGRNPGRRKGPEGQKKSRTSPGPRNGAEAL